MEDSSSGRGGGGGDHFPGFKTSFHKDDYCIFKRTLSCRLQRKAPCRLLLPPKPSTNTSSFSYSLSSRSSAETTAELAGVPPPAAAAAFVSACHQNNKDPIPLLSPLVLPSMLQPNPTSH
ncbi:PREDICTED: uncharacterized protein LOC109116338 [Tarenaya hassleriana]|uniref:uncharacterized protein LOC109116338 n=1 Tax=Tarenaya hassleriana TaxID=28532 RepID=UPI0008FCFE8A|nr:PREDICTED: uncharacterized protein LOC109116338 [Tarenaya hassleriana]